MERIICIKMDLALNNQQRLICHKTQAILNLPLFHMATQQRSYDDIISPVDDFFDQWDPTRKEKVCGSQWRLPWKINLIWSHSIKSILVKPWTFLLIFVYIIIIINSSWWHRVPWLSLSLSPSILIVDCSWQVL